MQSIMCIFLVILFLFAFHCNCLNASLKLKVVTVATDETDGLKRLRRSAEVYDLDLTVTGLGIEWQGGDVARFAGGGHKVNILKEKLEEWRDEPNTVIMFTDAYDVILTANAETILKKFLEFECKLVFAAEPFLWPDLGLERYYPQTRLGYKYLNSGGFIGYAQDVWNIVNDKPIGNDEDDQLFYSVIYVDKREQYDMRLDHRSHIFQNLNGAFGDVELEFRDNDTVLLNKLYQTYPAMVHGNGASKNNLNNLGNYLAQSWVKEFGCVHCDESIIESIDFSPENSPTIQLAIFVEGPTPFLTLFLDKISELSYPKKSIRLFLHNNYDYHSGTLNKWIKENHKLYKSYLIKSPHGKLDEAQAKNTSVHQCLEKSECEYLFTVNSDAMLTNKDIIQLLIQRNRSIIAPLIRMPGKYWSNFWGQVAPDGFYARSFDYFEIIQGDRKGIWNAAFISTAILYNREALEKGLNFESPDLSTDMAGPAFLREKGRFMYSDNQEEYGHLTDATNFDVTRRNPDMYMLYDNKLDWETVYLHENYSGNFEPDVNYSMPCPDVYNVPLVSPLYCQHLIEEMEFFGKWSGGGHNDARLAGGYENVPTVDIHMNQIGYEKHWLTIIKDYVLPVQEKIYVGYSSDGKAIMNFVVKYHPKGQKYLRPHHDSSTFTINVALNRHEIDFTGGGSNFLRYNCSVPQNPVGWLIMHPGRLTHYHEGLEIISGVRYIMNNWSSLESVGDQSTYVVEIQTYLHRTIPAVRDALSCSKKFFNHFCHKFASEFIPSLISNTQKCKPLSAIAVEQLMIDALTLKTTLLEMPSIGLQTKKAPASYQSIITKGFTRIDRILKVTMTPHENSELFIEEYLKLVEEREQSEFQKILEMKGLKRAEQNALMELYKVRISLHAPVRGDASPQTQESRLKKLEKMVKRPF
ncbi:Procollagen-lysine,2-oxoglutarate 5-dioxygenase 3 [Oopsacas minuta]|uniref:Procollagen-lysine,2-oxoglutarate 5-dioxygenase 3 n=1 Tax=Oopsacas minuta TaxID=111878 RepID=A0AAV7JGP6_9METZ|nr:Procollagen-lysine,2-oxoglutarate 5-dioxygenase 3 [Oopsacas minuta]